VRFCQIGNDLFAEELTVGPPFPSGDSLSFNGHLRGSTSPKKVKENESRLSHLPESQPKPSGTD
jgi:hypothetical protein